MAEITYEALREIQRQERRSEQLFDIDGEFYKKVYDYLERNSPDDALSAIEKQNATSIFKDIIDRRERKILNHALTVARAGKAVETKNMTTMEEELFQNVVDILKAYRHELDGENGDSGTGGHGDLEDEPKTEAEKKESTPRPSDAPTTEEKEEESESTKLIKVRVLENLPEIVGADMKEYGPFQEGDEVELPEENASIFIEKNKAEQVE